jgi:UDP-N-acetylmuramoyl-tripeptide--D-alanyl-D-alanine ligase
MIPMSLQQIASSVGGVLHGDNKSVRKVFTDSRMTEQLEDLSTSLFIALKGPHFDAHQFVSQVANASVGCVLVEHLCEAKCPQIVVPNSRLALAEIARLNRQLSDARYVAITGSSGKTTVKEMIAAILSNIGKTLATEGNFNNDIGAPLTLLNIDKSIEFGVIELGANHPGEVAFTADITKPDVAMVNNITAAHLEGFGSIQGVASAKAEIYSSLSDKGVAVLNADDEFYSYFDKHINTKKLSYSSEKKCDVYASEIKVNSDQSIIFTLNAQLELNGLSQQIVNLPLVGIHNVSNALAAASCCIALGIPLIDIATGLQQTPVVAGRLNVSMLKNQCRIVDDTYNANLSSMKAAIDLLGNYSSPRILVVGDMGELGAQGRQCHEEIGEYAFEKGIETLYSCGVLSQFSHFSFERKIQQENLQPHRNLRSNHFSNQQELLKIIINEAKPGATILVKGSRSAHMEKVVRKLKETIESNRSSLTELSETESDIASLQGEH